MNCPKCGAEMYKFLTFTCGSWVDKAGRMDDSEQQSKECRIRELENTVTGLKKANELLRKGMESQCELMDELKQRLRFQELEMAMRKDVQELTDICTKEKVCQPSTTS